MPYTYTFSLAKILLPKWVINYLNEEKIFESLLILKLYFQIQNTLN